MPTPVVTRPPQANAPAATKLNIDRFISIHSSCGAPGWRYGNNVSVLSDHYTEFSPRPPRPLQRHRGGDSLQQSGELLGVLDGAVSADESGEHARDEGGHGGGLGGNQRGIVGARLQVRDGVGGHGE